MDSESAPLIFSDPEAKPSPAVLTKLVKRLRSLTLTLLPVEVEPEKISEPTSRVITRSVVKAYYDAAGDFVEALPYCLLRARIEFMHDANQNPADYGENVGRATACEVLARRIVHMAPQESLNELMSTRFQHLQADGDKSDMSSALEMAIDTHCTIFLSSTEAQDVVNSLWKGEIIQRNNKNHDIEYVRYRDTRTDASFLGRLDPSRISVPRYQNMIRIVVWLAFLLVYSQAVRQPLDLKAPPRELDEWEIAMYTMALAFSFEDLNRLYKLLRFVTYRAFNFWAIISLITDGILCAAFVLRVIGMSGPDERSVHMRTSSFQVLSFAAPLIWMKLVTIFDGYKYIGMMQICVARMLQESGLFFALLSVLSIGFAQGMYALDASDGIEEDPAMIGHLLIQALLQAPDYAKFNTQPVTLLLYYFWGVITCLILLNILISLFSSAYSDVVDDAEAQYLAFFASKTIGMTRAPDSFVYPAPTNLIEIFLVSPFELLPWFSLSPRRYATLNRFVMGFVFFVPLTLIAFYEAVRNDTTKHAWVRRWLSSDDEGAADHPDFRDPEIEDGEEDELGRKITKVSYDDLVRKFPKTNQSSEALLLRELKDVKKTLALVLERLDGETKNGGTVAKKEEAE
ncbi:hypothetical protein MKEN_00107500 [Mycena kentingensis (nom. inval.)]|nr:hypothetical protein MKEN_00107500 [Mycena kentingensis (nom. inval.)]